MSEGERQDPAPGDPGSPLTSAGNRRRKRIDKRNRAGRRHSNVAPPPMISVVRVPRVSDLGPMPTGDTLAMASWMRRAMGVQLAQILADPEINESDRRKQATETARAIASLTPAADLGDAAALILGQQKDDDAGSGPPTETADVAAQSIGNGSSLPSAKRGRPPRRGFGAA